LHPRGVHRSVVEAVLSGDPEAACSAMRKHATEFGEILVRMEETYRKKKSILLCYRQRREEDSNRRIPERVPP